MIHEHVSPVFKPTKISYGFGCSASMIGFLYSSSRMQPTYIEHHGTPPEYMNRGSLLYLRCGHRWCGKDTAISWVKAAHLPGFGLRLLRSTKECSTIREVNVQRHTTRAFNFILLVFQAGDYLWCS
jgi:hypothetical protein